MSTLIVLVPIGGVLLLALAMARPRSRPRKELTRQAVDAIDGLLPQTQCGQCAFPGCRPYAEALVEGRARANQCPPGGLVTMRAISRLLGVEGGGLPPPPEAPARVALVDESLCIGCLKCIKACPVDAIIGAKGMLHTVIRQDCTGCELCVAPCPVDCISMEPVRPRTREWVWSKPGAWRGTAG